MKGISAFSRFRHYTNLHKCESRLRRVLDDFSFGTMREVLEGRGLLGGAIGAVRPPPRVSSMSAGVGPSAELFAMGIQSCRDDEVLPMDNQIVHRNPHILSISSLAPDTHWLGI